MGEQIEDVFLKYVEGIRSDLSERWAAWPLDLEENELHEVVGALLARQVTLASNFAMGTGMWNGHIAPILLRTMADTYITLAWILKDPIDRARKYLMYGLGQAKLQVEHRRAQLIAEEENPDNDPIISALEEWITSQRYPFLTEVDVGTWSGISTRDMAEEAGCLDYYRYVYMPFSSCVHSMWHHIGRYNLEPCVSSLHRGHKLPIDPELEIDPYYFYLAAKYVGKTFRLFDSEIRPNCTPSCAFANFEKRIDQYEREAPSEASRPS
jgi:hypothetical protein